MLRNETQIWLQNRKKRYKIEKNWLTGIRSQIPAPQPCALPTELQRQSVSLKHDGSAKTDWTGATGHKSYRFAAKINLRALTQTSHMVVHTMQANNVHHSLQLNFCWCPIWPLQLLSHLFWLSDGTDGPSPVSRLAVPSVPSCFRLTHASRWGCC